MNKQHAYAGYTVQPFLIQVDNSAEEQALYNGRYLYPPQPGVYIEQVPYHKSQYCRNKADAVHDHHTFGRFIR